MCSLVSDHVVRSTEAIMYMEPGQRLYVHKEGYLYTRTKRCSIIPCCSGSNLQAVKEYCERNIKDSNALKKMNKKIQEYNQKNPTRRIEMLEIRKEEDSSSGKSSDSEISHHGRKASSGKAPETVELDMLLAGFARKSEVNPDKDPLLDGIAKAIEGDPAKLGELAVEALGAMSKPSSSSESTKEPTEKGATLLHGSKTVGYFYATCGTAAGGFAAYNIAAAASVASVMAVGGFFAFAFAGLSVCCAQGLAKSAIATRKAYNGDTSELTAKEQEIAERAGHDIARAAFSRTTDSNGDKTTIEG